MSHSKAGLRHEQLPLHHVLPVFDKSSDFIALQKVNSQLIQNNREIFYLFYPSIGPTVKMPLQLSAVRWILACCCWNLICSLLNQDKTTQTPKFLNWKPEQALNCCQELSKSYFCVAAWEIRGWIVLIGDMTRCLWDILCDLCGAGALQTLCPFSTLGWPRIEPPCNA